jgi:hypothetical protein
VNASKILKVRGPGYLQAKRGYLGGVPSKSLTGKLPEGESQVCEDLETPPIMCQFVLQDPAFFASLFHVDEDHAATVRYPSSTSSHAWAEQEPHEGAGCNPL